MNTQPKGNHAQKPKTRTSLFNLAKRTPQGPRVICRDLTFTQASGLVKEIPEALLIKFSKMEALS